MPANNHCETWFEAVNLELCLPCEWQKHRYLKHHLECALAGHWIRIMETQTRNLIWNVNILNGSLTDVQHTYPASNS